MSLQNNAFFTKLGGLRSSFIYISTALGAVLFALLANDRLAFGQQLVVVETKLPVSESPTFPELVSPVPEEQLTLAALEQMAISSNPSLARASSMVGAARGKWIQVGQYPNPTIGYEGQQLGSGGRAEQQGLLFSQEIVHGDKLRLNRVIADREMNRTQQEMAAQRQRVLTDVRIAYYQALLAQRQIDLTSILVRVSTEGSEVVKALLGAKEASRADVLLAELEVENAKILAQNARNRHASAWQTLTAVVANPKLPPLPLAGDAFVEPRDISYQDVLARLQTSSPEMAVAVAEIDRARATLARACAEPIPNVTVQGLVNVIDNGIGGRPDGGISVSLPIPLFNRNQGAILQARHEIAAAERALQQLELDLQNRLAPTFERFANARNQFERYQTTILPAAKESLDLTRKMYEAGETNYVGLLVAQRTYFQTNLNFLEATQLLRLSETEIEGFLLSNSLQMR